MRSDRKVSQLQRPTGWRGRFMLWRMNSGHSKLTDWGLEHVTVEKHDTILDVGCGGGRTIGKLAAKATDGRVYGVDYSEASVAASRRTNALAIRAGRVEVRLGAVSQLPFGDHMFDLVTAVETHFWWPDLSIAMREIHRVLKPGGRLIIIAEVYRGANTIVSRLAEQAARLTGMTLLSAEEHRQLFVEGGYSELQVVEQGRKGWICAIGRRA